MRASVEVRLRSALVTMALLTVQRIRAETQGPAASLPGGEPQGSDVFVTAREALVRDKPGRAGRVVGKLPGGSRVRLLNAGEQSVRVEIAAGAGGPEIKNPPVGFLSRDAVCFFAPDGLATAGLIAAGRALSGSPPHRRLAVAFLLRGSERLRASSPGDPAVEVLLGETAEALAAAGGPFPPGLEVSRSPGPPVRWVYSGEAFRRALALTVKAEGETARLRDRAMAGAVRQQYVQTSASLMALWNETAAWLSLVESVREPVALASSAESLGSASLALGRLLVASGRLQEQDTVRRRVTEAAARVRSILPAEAVGRRLASRAAVLAAMKGNGSAPFPQEALAKAGPKEIVARIEGELGALSLTVETVVGGATRGRVRKAAVIPVLPVPGSLRVSPDGRSAAWLEIAGPSKLLPVIASLDRDEPAREVAYLSSGRPLRDRTLTHVVASLAGYSRDGQRLGLWIEAWNDTPGPRPRYSIVAASTGKLLYETSMRKRFDRLLD